MTGLSSKVEDQIEGFCWGRDGRQQQQGWGSGHWKAWGWPCLPTPLCRPLSLSPQQGPANPDVGLCCPALSSRVCKNNRQCQRRRADDFSILHDGKERGLDPIQCLCLGEGAWDEGGLSGPSTAADQRLARTTSDVRCAKGATAGTETGPRRRTADSTRLSGPAEGDASCPPKNSPCGELSVSELLQDASSLTKGLRAPTRQRCDVEQSRSALQLLAVGLTLGPSQCPRASLETRDQQADAGVRELAHRETRRID